MMATNKRSRDPLILNRLQNAVVQRLYSAGLWSSLPEAIGEQPVWQPISSAFSLDENAVIQT
jgi:hypothetical protein